MRLFVLVQGVGVLRNHILIRKTLTCQVVSTANPLILEFVHIHIIVFLARLQCGVYFLSTYKKDIINEITSNIFIWLILSFHIFKLNLNKENYLI